jgi:thiol-disulfide isomerase/thioredoxin
VRGLLLVAAVCALVAGCGGESDERAMPAAPAETAPADAAQRPAVPALDGVDLDGERISLADLRDRPVLINVWSSWWSTCQSEAVAYAEFQDEHPELAYLGINVADTPDEARAFVERYGWDWPSIRDPSRERARRFGADYQPHFILVDEDGRVVTTHEGRGDDEIWESLVAQL